MQSKLMLKQYSSALLENVKRADYAGYDPFDGLNSKLFNALGFGKSAFLRLAWLQVFKRLPVNLRPLVMVPKKRNPKGVALFIMGLLNDYERTQDNSYLQEAIKLGDWLIDQANKDESWGGACWGYHFPWQAKAFYVPAGKPNVITTLYVSRALFRFSKYDESTKFRDIALSSASFIEQTLLSEDENGNPFIAYIPGEKAFVHNASLWGAYWLVLAGTETNNQSMVAKGVDVINRSVAEQLDDGAWRYGSMAHHQFIDGFHTGYNLEAIYLAAQVLKTNEYDACIEKGLAYYRENFFLEDGTPKYYNNAVFPIDLHSAAQAVITLTVVSGSIGDMQLAERVICWSVDNLFLPKKAQFVYQVNKHFTNKINYIRWTQAWGYLMLSHFNLVDSND